MSILSVSYDVAVEWAETLKLISADLVDTFQEICEELSELNILNGGI
jgi:hypothetical protein